jgi:GR25 family glycosyltransferase involved in LPS biosynthesis
MRNFKKNEYFLGVLLILCLLLIWSSIIHWKYQKKEGFENNVDYMDGVDVIYWINLDRSTHRREIMENMLSDPVFNNIPKIRFSAVDGKNVNVFSMVDKNPNFTRTNVEYACLLSHLEVIRTFYESKQNHEVALILEDDISLDFKKYWRETIQEIIDNAPQDWEIIQLCYFGFRCSALPVKLYDDQTILYSTGAYIINRKGAQKIADSYKNHKYILDMNVDISADIYLYKVMKKYAYRYPYFIFKSQNDSTIHSQDVKCHENSKQITKQMLENELNPNL